ncbi:hypothetical protein G7046_g2669 [Stylonectria norvegica]|nr:hypothetical protein G7046_g2669 [Stylonectria norvegica]
MWSGPKRAAIACSYCRQRSDDVNTEDSPTQRLEAIEALLREHSVALEALRNRPAASVSNPSPSQGIGLAQPDYGSSAASSSNSPMPFSFWQFYHAGGGANPHEQDMDTTPPLTIPLGHQTSTSNLLVLPQVRRLIGEYPEEFLFRIENSRPRSTTAQSITLPLDGGLAEEFPVIDKSVADSYLENFLTQVHPFHPFLDKEELVEQYERIMSRGLASDIESALFLAIFALGATAADPINNTQTSFPGDELIQRALKILYASWMFCFSGKISTSQALVLCALYFTYTVEPLIAWRLIHMASTNIQQILARCKDELTGEVEITRLSWVCFIIECDILAEFHQPRSGIELLVDRMPFPDYGKNPAPENLYTLAEISSRSLLNRIHHVLFSTDSLTLYKGLGQENQASSPHLDPDASLLRVCGELNRQLETWYESLPEVIKPDLTGAVPGNGQICLLRLRYWSSKQIIYRAFVVYVTSQSMERDFSVSPSVIEMCDLCLTGCRMFVLTASHLLAERTPRTYSAAQCIFSCMLVLSIAARCPPLQSLVEDIEMLQQLTIEALEPWAQEKTSIKCALEIATSISTKQVFRG